MRFFAHIVLVFFIACCGIDSTENDAAKADTHKLVFDELANNRIVNGQQVKVQIEDREGEVVEEGSLASLSVTLGRKCDNEESYQNMATVDAVKGIATFTIDNSWTDGDCAVRATADGVTEAVEDGITVGAELLNIEMIGSLGTLQVKQVFALKVKATTSDKKAYDKGEKLYLHGPSDLRQFGGGKAEATVDAQGTATFNNLYFIAPVTTDIQLIVASEDGGQSGTIILTSEVMLQPLAGMVGSVTFNFKEKTLALTGLNTATVAGKIKYSIRNSVHADEHKILCSGDTNNLAIGDSKATAPKTTCLEGLKKDDLDGMIVDVLTVLDAQTRQVRSTPLLVNYGN